MINTFKDSLIVSDDIANVTEMLPKFLHTRDEYRNKYLNNYIERLKNEYNLLRHEFPNTDFLAQVRIKSYESTYDKILKNLKDKRYENIYDIFANRYIINSVNGISDSDLLIKTVFDFKNFLVQLNEKNFLPERFKNYIDNPKDSSYQSLHITRKSENPKYFYETQIRTNKMHENAKSGHASHKSKYKKRISSPQNLPDRFTYLLDENGFCIDVVPIPFEKSFEEFFGEKYDKKEIMII